MTQEQTVEPGSWWTVPNYPAQEVHHYHFGIKYRIQFEQAASTKGQLGFKVEANGDELDLVKASAIILLNFAKTHAPPIADKAKTEVKE